METSFFYWVVSVLLFICSECLICVHAVFAILRLCGRLGRDDCQSALWDCFWGRICRHVENGCPKTVPQCTLKPSRPGLPRNLKVANSVGPRKNNGRERETPIFALGICEFHQSYFQTNYTLKLIGSEVGFRRGLQTFIQECCQERIKQQPLQYSAFLAHR